MEKTLLQTANCALKARLTKKGKKGIMAPQYNLEMLSLEKMDFHILNKYYLTTERDKAGPQTLYAFL